MGQSEIDPLTGVETTGHDFDGIKELKNPIQKWWIMVFFGCVAFAIGQVYLAPSWPGADAAYSGALIPTNREALVVDMAEAQRAQQDRLDEIAALEVSDILETEELLSYAAQGGEAAFNVNCAGCHGVGAGGQLGYFPNLADDDWLWGGAPDQIHETILYGVRSEHDDARYSEMPRYGVDELLTQAEIESVARYVMTLSDQAKTASLSGTPGAEIYAEQCSACHGDIGEGIVDLGAPALNDFVWLYAGDGQGNPVYEKLVAQIYNPRLGVMPSWTGRISDETIKMLAVYVHGLGGGR
ncbi:MAG: cytochrome-c oxidase, cbb3-type subunit III [Pseudomonadota bacterium]